MAILIGLNDKYYRLKENCEECQRIFKNESPENWTVCKKCGHIHLKTEKCECESFINKDR